MARFREVRGFLDRAGERGRGEKRRGAPGAKSLRNRELEEDRPWEEGVVDDMEEDEREESALRAAFERSLVTMAGYSVRYHWLGIYLADEGGDLHLAVFRGEHSPHEHIAQGKGICGAVAGSGVAEIVPDVNADPRYLCCSLAVKSEIVIPIRAGGRVAGVIDIDSHEPTAFGDADLRFLEGVAAELGRKIEAHERSRAREEAGGEEDG